MDRKEIEKQLRLLNQLGKRLPWIVLGVVILTVIVTVIQLLLRH